MSRLLGSAVLFSVVGLSGAARGAYTVVAVGPITVPVEAAATAVNQNGLVVGQYASASGTMGFGYSNGSRQSFGPGGGTTELLGVNSSGVAVGYSGSNGVMVNSAGSGASLVNIGTFGTGTVASGINDTGLIVGESQYPTSPAGSYSSPYGFYTQAGTGTLTPLTPAGQQSPTSTAIGGAGSMAMAVNNSGTIVGQASAGSNLHAFVYSGGTMFDLGTANGNPAEISAASAINSAGDIAGYSSDSVGGNETAFLYIGYHVTGGVLTTGAYTVLPGFGGDTFAYGINSSDEVVGSSQDAGGNQSAFAWLPGQTALTNLNTEINPASGWDLLGAYGVNSAGDIVGYGTLNGVPQAFLLAPATAPEPSSIGLCLLSAGLLRRRDKSLRS